MIEAVVVKAAHYGSKCYNDQSVKTSVITIFQQGKKKNQLNIFPQFSGKNFVLKSDFIFPRNCVRVFCSNIDLKFPSTRYKEFAKH